jgi:hypothetical protein
MLNCLYVRYNWIQNILDNDNQATGCANLGSEYVCASGSGI